ncbi:MAG: DUF4058 family protein [Gemmataceae bacterium]
MPLLDHFRPPIWTQTHWESFHTRWAVSIANALNRRLPKRFTAEPQVHVGSRIESDVAEFDTRPGTRPEPVGGRNGTDHGPGGEGGVAVAVEPAVATDPTTDADYTLTVPVGLIDQFAIDVWDTERGFRLAGAIELVSPGNKDRADARQMFVGKAAGYLLTGVGLVVVDVVTNRSANLHNELIRLHGGSEDQLMPDAPATYTAAYAPTPGPKSIRLDVWAAPLVIGQELPPRPLKVLGFGIVMVDLAATYREACEWSRLG